MTDFWSAIEAAAVNAKHQIAELYTEAGQERTTSQKTSAAVLELTFSTLRFEIQKGAKLGDYEIAYKQANLPDKWHGAFNVLRVNNATIKERYHGEGYEHSYWLYGEDKIYRQKLIQKVSANATANR